MKIEFLFTGKTTDLYIRQGVELYLERLKHYVPSDYSILPAGDTKSGSEKALIAESKAQLSKLLPRDFLVVLDENGRQYSSREFANTLNRWMINSPSRILFLVGGAYGVAGEVRERAGAVLSLSKMTFTHQMVRLIV